MVLIGGALFAAVFASWRIAIAARQHDLAEQRHLSERFQRAAEFLAHSGQESAYIRISGLNALRYLVRDAPEAFALQVADVVIPFMLMKPIAEGQPDVYREFNVGRITLEFILETVDGERFLDDEQKTRLRQDIRDALGVVLQKLDDAGFHPRFPPS